MYLPPLFASADEALAAELVDAHPFATLITVKDGEPVLSQIPVVRDGPRLIGHLARANPQSRSLPGRVTVLFGGPHAYVSPRWYRAPGEHVPTWNYAAVEVRGEATVAEGAEVLRRLVSRFEPAWSPDDALLASLLPAIVAFEVPWAGWRLKVKLSQNRAPDDAEGARAALAAGGPAEQAVAAWMARVRAR